MAEDPVLCAQFFNKFITAFLSSFLGFDVDKLSSTFSSPSEPHPKSSSTENVTLEGPLLNKTIFTGNKDRGLKAFYGTVEAQGRGSLHLHLLIWLNGLPDPDQLMERINKELERLSKGTSENMNDEVPDPEKIDNVPVTGWLKDVADYLESIIEQQFPRFTPEEKNNIPDVPPADVLSIPPSYYQEVPLSQDQKDTQNWKQRCDLHFVTTKTVKHRFPCKKVCFKYGTTTCRFNYPRPIIQVTGFKNGVIQLKRLDTLCNNYNKAIISCLRCNMDVKFITNGQDAKATIFYITDYVTKSEMSIFESVTLARDAVEKIDKNEYPRRQDPNLTASENMSRRRIYTFLNILDSHVERSGQWVATLLLGLPLEYSSHKFKSFSTMSFVNFVHMNTEESGSPNPPSVDGDTLDEFLDPSLTESFTVDMTEDQIILTNQRVDYRYRCADGTANTDRYQEIERNRLDPEQDLAQMSPFEYVKRVVKKKLSKETQSTMEEFDGYLDDSPVSGELPTKQFLFHTEHPQHKTHVQVVSTCSNPKLPHPIPVMLSYTFPSQETDEDKFYLMVLSLLTPYEDPQAILRDKNGNTITFKKAYDDYRTHLQDTDPFQYLWFSGVIKNLQALSSGREQQKKEKLERERLRREQNLLDDSETNEPLPGYDYAEDDVDDVDDEFQCDKDFINTLPPSGPHRSVQAGNKYATELNCLSKMEFPNKTIPKEPTKLSGKQVVDQLDDFNDQLAKAKSSILHQNEQPSSHVFHKTADQISKDSKLDNDQRAAFFTLAHHILKVELWKKGVILTKPKQMLFYLGGEGGTGKSKVVKALTEFMVTVGLRHKLRLCAFTGAAADNIEGSTVNTLLGIRINKGKKRKKAVAEANQTPDRIKAGLSEVDVFLVDEVSMIGQCLLHNMDSILKDVHGNPTELFGGSTMIFAGDFYQLQPVSKDPLYKKPSCFVVGSATLTVKNSGYRKWHDLTDSIFLKTQYRIKDPEYRDVVTRFRHGKSEQKDDEYLKTKQLHNNNCLSHLDHCPTIIVKDNDFRCYINFQKAYEFASKTKQKLFFSVAKDKDTSRPIPDRVRRALLCSPDGAKTGYGTGLLPLVVGMPVMFKNNVGTEIGICNGTMGTIVDLQLDPREVSDVDYGSPLPHYLLFDVVVFIKIINEKTKFQLKGLEPNVYPLINNSTNSSLRRKMKFNYVDNVTKVPSTCFHCWLILHIGQTYHKSSQVEYSITRKQLWILPAFSITVDSSQGRSLDSAIIHLGGVRSHISPNLHKLTSLSQLPVGIFKFGETVCDDVTVERREQSGCNWFLETFIVTVNTKQ